MITDLPGGGRLGSRPAAADVAPRLTFEDVYQEHYRFVWRVLRAFGLPRAAVEDAAQDVFVVVHRRLAEFEGREKIRSWLFHISRWVVTEQRRRFGAKPAHEPIDESVRDGGPGPFEMAARSEALRRVEEIISRMDDDKRIAFVLLDIEEMTGHEVAELLGISVNTVYSRLRLAREQFRRLLQESTPPERNEP